MPKASTNEDRAKVKLRVIEFELEGGNASVENSIRQLTHALSLRNGTPIAPPKTPKEIGVGSPPPATEIEDPAQDAEYTDVPETTTEPTAKPAKPKASYEPPIPNYLPELDPALEFKEYAAASPQTKHTKRYLVTAIWLRDVKQLQSVTIDHIYTCYKNAGWPITIRDWDSNFRSLVGQKWMRRTETGQYAVNPLGEGKL
jgi:hypothetical protein